MRAPDFYVVSGLNVTSESRVIRSVQLQFAKIESDLRIDVNDTSLSKTAGKAAGTDQTISSYGQQITGMYGRTKGQLAGLGLLTIKGRAARSGSDDY